jgi:SulP family sulfate permease
MFRQKSIGSHPVRRFKRAMKGVWGEIAGFGAGRGLKAVPYRGEFAGYNGSKLGSDLRAALNVALLAFPQGMAYALVAGLPIHFGITCSAVAALLAPLFAGSRHPILGPTNATAFMVFSYFAAYPGLASEAAHFMPLLVLMVGLLLVFGAIFRVADLIQYVSRSVIVGYIAGASLLIIANQMQHVLGVDAAGGRSFFTIAGATLKQLPAAQWATIGLGGGTIALYLVLGKVLKGWPNFAISLAVATLVSANLSNAGGIEVPTFGSVDLGSLLPDLSVFGQPGLFDTIAQLFGLAFGLAFLASLENSVMSKTLSSRTGDRPDVNQDMLGVGVANLGCAFFSGMVASGSLTRSALNYSSGAASRLSSWLSALFCVLGLFALAKYIHFVPKCALAALVIVVAISLINLKQVRICFAATRSDGTTLFVTFFAALIMPLHVAIFIGVGTAIALFLRQAARPELVEYDFAEGGELNELRAGEERKLPALSIVHVEGELFFGAAELFRNQIQATASDPNLKVIVLRMKNARHLDATSVFALVDLVEFLRAHDRELIISGVMKEVYRVLKRSGAVQVIGKENIFPGSVGNPNLATRNALKRAQEILGTREIDVRIFHDPSRDADG